MTDIHLITKTYEGAAEKQFGEVVESGQLNNDWSGLARNPLIEVLDESSDIWYWC